MTSATTSTTPTLLMIDAGTARDRDDAFTVTPHPDGSGWAVEVHIAGVADIVTAGSVADEQAFLRAATRYLPNRTIPMLGDTAEQAATLSTDNPRSSLRMTGTLTPDGHLIDAAVDRGQIPAGRCTPVDHAQVPAILTNPAHPLHATLTAADAATQALLTARRDGGALAFYDLTRGWATNEDGAIVAIPDALRTVAYVIVQELMIATNEAVALWCIDQGLPILFRNHRPNPVAGSTTELMTEIASAAADPDLFAKLRGRLLSTLRAASYNPTVHGHYGLRLSAYTHITSPLRRVADLINQRIVFAHLDGSPTPYTPGQLTALGDDLNRRTREAREAKKIRFTRADHRHVAREAARNLTALDARTFHKVLKAAADQPLPVEVATELTRRLEADTLTVADVALVIDAADPTWHPVRLHIVDTLAAAHPEMGPSVVSIWRQAHPDHPEPVLDTRSRGADHDRTFAARAAFRGTRGPWMFAPAKKHAEQSALWAALRAHLTGTEHPATEPLWPPPPPTPQPADEPETQPPASAPTAAVATAAGLTPLATIVGLSETKKRKALSNPVAWLTSLAQNEQLPTPHWDYHTDGPAHAPRFTATAHLAGRTTTATAGSKTAAKTAAATALVETILTEY
jgi:ribonuclease R